MEQLAGAEMAAGRLAPAVVVHEAPKFDLDAYIANYIGRTKVRRLLLIGACSPVLRTEALKAAITAAAAGNDVKQYLEAQALLRQYAKGASELDDLDPKWVEKKEKVNKAETSRLENELKGYKNNLIRESIRMGNEDLGNHYYSIGDTNNALKAYSRMRDHCQTPAHIASTSFRIIQVAVEQGNWLAVSSQVHKIRNLQVKAEELSRNQPRTQAAMGLQHMCQGEYREAATNFLSTDPSLGDTYNEVLSSNDVAVYGGLCALASMDRNELQSKVLENASFRNFLELEPHIRRAISFFCSSKYAQCLDILEAYRADYLLDIYLQAHVPNIYRRVRTKSIVQYFAPFSRVTLDAMAQTFGTTATPHPMTTVSSNLQTTSPANRTSPALPTTTTVQSIEEELTNLIEKGILNARIDLDARVLIAEQPDVRADVHAEAQTMVQTFIREARLRILRMNALNAGLEVKPAPKAGKGGGVALDGVDMPPVDKSHHAGHSGASGSGGNSGGTGMGDMFTKGVGSIFGGGPAGGASGSGKASRHG